MTDNLGPLRQAMSDLAEHGGNTDLYARTLRKSRQSQRRATLATGAAAVAVVFAIGGAVAFANADGPGRSTPVATQPPTPSGAPPTPSATPSGAPSSAAASTARRTTTRSSAPSSAQPTGSQSRYPDCPSAKSLEKLVDLPEEWRFVPSSVQCWRGWATAKPAGPDHGDGIYLFKYKTGTGWRYHSQGSAYDCADLGITSGNPPFCQMG